MKTIQVAVIGCGTIASSEHIPAYIKNPMATIKYFCDILPERAQAKVSEYGCGIAVTDYHEILNDPDIQAVSVCTPNHMHAIISMDFLRAGKHVLCEKPAARTYDEAVQMAAVQKETGMILNIGVVNRFNDAVQHIKRMIDAGDLGSIYHVYGSFRAQRSIPGLGGPFTTQAIAGGGVLIDWGVHFLDLIMYCLSDPAPVTVSGQTYSKLGVKQNDYTYVNMWAGPPTQNGTYDVEDFVTGLIRTKGPTITIQGSWAQNIGVNEMYVDFLGEKAGIRLQYGKGFTVYSTKDGMLTEMIPSFTTSSMFYREIDAFLHCIRSGEKLPSHIDYVLPTAKIMQSIYDSSLAGKEITC